MTSALFIMARESDPEFDAKRRLIVQLADAHGVEAVFPEYAIHKGEFIVEEAKAAFAAIDIVIVDVTLERPSCYFELGFAEALSKEIRLIAKDGTRVHQTSHRQAVAYYSGMGEYEQRISRILSNAD